VSGDLSRYSFVRPLGSGGAADVYEAILKGDQMFERRVAIKRPLGDGDPSLMRSFVDEARIASALHHANIVSVLDFGTSEDRPFMVCELVDGLDLESAITRAMKVANREPATGDRTIVPGRAATVEANGAIPLAVALHIVTEVAHALAYAHNAMDPSGRPMKIVHRDVSPENILLSWQADVKLSDFGIAHAMRRQELTKAGVTKGKLGYIAPEQLGGKDVDGRADIFALGSVLHRLITGTSPNANEAMHAQLARGDAPVLDPNIPPDVRAVLSRSIHGDRERRYPDALAFAKALGAALMGRLKEDGRSTLQTWLASLAPVKTLERRIDLFDVPLHESVGIPLPRFETAAMEPPPEPTRATEVIPAPNEDPNIGQVIHGFRIEARIGAGAMARLYRARHLTLERQYAVKLMNGDIAAHPKAQQRFKREAQQLSRVRHPNVVEIADFGTTPSGQMFIAMQHLEGRSLGKALEADGPFAPSRARAIVRDLAAGLSALENEGLVHRDLKPQNIMLVGPEERAVIVDFGLVRALDSDEVTRLTRQGDMLGTISYMAPEQIESADSAEPASDRYALGAILYAMIAGKPPFGRKVAEVIDGHLNRVPPPLPSAGGLDELAMALLAKTPSARPGIETILQLLDSLPLVQITASMLASADALAAQLPTPDRRGLPPPETRQAGKIALGVAAFAVGALVVAAWIRANLEPGVIVEPPPKPQPVTQPVTQRPTVVAEPVVAVPAEPEVTPTPSTPPKTPRPIPTASAAPKKTDVERLENVRLLLEVALGERGLRLAADAWAIGPAPKTRALLDALTGRNPDQAEKLLPESQAEIAKLTLDGALIDRLLGRIEQGIAKIPADRRAAFEQRQLDITDRATRRDVVPDPKKVRAIVQELLVFEREVISARGG